uniref:Akirin-2 n=1 Tax=Cyprinus carpio TaxID=7962 RepID=A0A8C1JRI2_CYPCA
MACGATLKRTLDFDPLLNPASPKRRRCAPLTPSSSSASPQKYLRMEPSPFGRVTSALTTEQILSNIKQEYKRMQKRRHLESSFQQSESCCPLEPQAHACISGTATLPGASSGSASPSRREQPLFTLKQVGMICERLLKEREEKVREEYDEILTTKLAGICPQHHVCCPVEACLCLTQSFSCLRRTVRCFREVHPRPADEALRGAAGQLYVCTRLVCVQHLHTDDISVLPIRLRLTSRVQTLYQIPPETTKAANIHS